MPQKVCGRYKYLCCTWWHMHFIFDNVPKSNSFNIGSNASNVSKKKSSIKSGAFRKKHVIRYRKGKREKLKLSDFGAFQKKCICHHVENISFTYLLCISFYPRTRSAVELNQNVHSAAFFNGLRYRFETFFAWTELYLGVMLGVQPLTITRKCGVKLKGKVRLIISQFSVWPCLK